MKKLILLLFIPLVFACSDDKESTEYPFNNNIIGEWYNNKVKNESTEKYIFRENRTFDWVINWQSNNPSTMVAYDYYFRDDNSIMYKIIKAGWENVELTLNYKFYPASDSAILGEMPEMFYKLK